MIGCERHDYTTGLDVYAVYLRKSRADAEKEAVGEYETLARHESELADLARTRGLVADEPYRELASGERISERPEFRRLMDKVRDGFYAGVIVHSVSRLGRGDPMEYGWVLMVLRMSHTVIVTPSRTYDPCDEDDARCLQMEMFVSNMELGSIKSRLTAGERASAKAGCYIKPTPPLGYDRACVDGKWTLVPNADAPLVRSIFERVAAGESKGGVASSLNDSGVRTPKGGIWTAARIGSIVRNPHYKGVIRYGYYKRVKVPTEGFGVRETQRLDPEGCIVADGLHEPIVDEGTWDAANAHNGRSPSVKGGLELKNPLAGLLVCSKCGRAMVRYVNTQPGNGKKVEHYRHPPFGDCRMRGARMDLVVGMVADALSDAAEDVLVERPRDARESEREALESAIESAERRSQRLLDAYLGGAMTVSELRERRDACDAELAEMRMRRDEIDADGLPPEEASVRLEDAVAALKSDVSARAKNDALKSVVEKIGYDNRTVSWAHPDIRLDVRLR